MAKDHGFDSQHSSPTQGKLFEHTCLSYKSHNLVLAQDGGKQAHRTTHVHGSAALAGV